VRVVVTVGDCVPATALWVTVAVGVMERVQLLVPLAVAAEVAVAAPPVGVSAAEALCVADAVEIAPA